MQNVEISALFDAATPTPSYAPNGVAVVVVDDANKRPGPPAPEDPNILRFMPEEVGIFSTENTDHDPFIVWVRPVVTAWVVPLNTIPFAPHAGVFTKVPFRVLLTRSNTVVPVPALYALLAIQHPVRSE